MTTQVCSNRPASGPKGKGLLEHRAVFSEMAATPECAEALAAPTKDKGKGGHMTYNSDGFYVKAAACYIATAYKKVGGS